MGGMKMIVQLELILLSAATVAMGAGYFETCGLEPEEAEYLTNGKFLESAIIYHDSVAFLASNEIGLTQWIGLQPGGATPAQVAAQFGLTTRASSALLVTLCRLGVVEIEKDDEKSIDDVTYSLTFLAGMFLAASDDPASTSPFIDTMAANFITPAKLLQVSKAQNKNNGAGENISREHLDGSNMDAKEDARQYMKRLYAQSYSCAEAFPSALGLDLRPLVLLDVGGGPGIYTIAAAYKNPSLQGLILELPDIVPLSQEYINEAGLSERVAVVEGDFLSDNPFPSADIVLFANIFHEWPDETNIKLVKYAFDCLSPGGRIVISEMLLADDIQSSTSASTAMNIQLIARTVGRQYRPKELHRRLVDSGFIACNVAKLVDDYSLVIARKPLSVKDQP